MRSGFSYLCLATLVRVASYNPSFVAIFHKYISFCKLSCIFKKIILKQIKLINNLLILHFSLSSHCGCRQKEIMKLFLIANMLLNRLTRGLKTVCNWPRPSLEVTQEVRTWGICLKLNSLMNFSFIIYLNSFKQFVHCSLVSGCDRYLLKKYFKVCMEAF